MCRVSGLAVGTRTVSAEIKKVIAAKPVPFSLQTVLCMALVGLQHLPALWEGFS